MTERGRHDVTLAPERFRVGPSALTWHGDRLEIAIDERCAPIPHPMRGQITVHLERVVDQAFTLDAGGQHRWHPMAPGARVELDLQEPALRWQGEGYLDGNDGDTPLEAGFRQWDWTRLALGGGRTAILYNTQPRDEAPRHIALDIARDGSVRTFEPPEAVRLPPTRVWRIARPARADEDGTPLILRTLEDTPFYSRSMVSLPLFGAARTGVHESLDGDRLRRTLVKAMLPFRMPRRASREA